MSVPASNTMTHFGTKRLFRKLSACACFKFSGRGAGIVFLVESLSFGSRATVGKTRSPLPGAFSSAVKAVRVSELPTGANRVLRLFERRASGHHVGSGSDTIQSH